MLTKSQILKKLKDMKAKALTASFEQYTVERNHFPKYMEIELNGLHTEEFKEAYNFAVREMNRMSEARYATIMDFLKSEDLRKGKIFDNHLGTEGIALIQELYKTTNVQDWQFEYTAYGQKAIKAKRERDEKIETEFNALIGNAMSMKTNEIRALSKSLGLEIEDKPCTALLSPTDMSYLKEVIKKCQETT